MFGRLFGGVDPRHAAAAGTVHMRALIAIVLLGAPAMAIAQPGPRCRIDAEGLEFGQYRTLDSFPNLARNRIIVDCGDDTLPARVTISAGNSGDPQRRAMRGGSEELIYNLYVDPARRIVAGDGSAGTAPLIPRLRLPNRNVYLVFGEIFARQPVSGGEYSDRIRVDLEF